MNWAIAGRNQKRLDEINEILEKPVDILIAVSENIEGLKNIVKIYN